MSSLGGNPGFRDKPVAGVIKSIDDAENAHELVEVINPNMARGYVWNSMSPVQCEPEVNGGLLSFVRLLMSRHSDLIVDEWNL
jgi:hypothetical protein